jgi:putative ABC transport system permease protein
MRLLIICKLALRSLHRNVLRSSLTSLGIVIGVGSVIVLVAVGTGARRQIENRIARLGQNVVVVFPGSFNASGVRTGAGGRQSLVPADVHAIEREVPFLAGVSPEVRSREQVLANGFNWNTQVLGESSDYLDIRHWPLAAGAMFSPEDVARKAKVAVVGTTVLRELGFGEQVIGQTIRVEGVLFRIVGVLASRGFTEGRDEDDVMIVPYTSHMTRLARRNYVSSILLATRDEQAFDEVQQAVTDLLRERHGIPPDGEADFVVRTQDEIVSTATATTDTLTTFLGMVAGVSLLVGGIGIMNILLMSVTERTREIGLRLALGAHSRDVLLQFLAEAALLSAGGGLCGLVLGYAGAEVLSNIKGWPVSVPAWGALAALTFSAGVGIFFGYYPARRAAQLDPIEALRFE